MKTAREKINTAAYRVATGYLTVLKSGKLPFLLTAWVQKERETILDNVNDHRLNKEKVLKAVEDKAREFIRHALIIEPQLAARLIALRKENDKAKLLKK